MSKAFTRLHPLLVHHIVNSLGWRGLRPLQEAAIEPVLAGENGIFLAPTAGGKTEAAVFPVLSHLLSEPRQGLNVLYVCPIKALLNNLVDRLSYYAGLVGLRAAVWHGDVGAAQRRAIRRDPPEILLTTPESLEVMLISRATDAAFLFKSVRFCIVDEIHAFAGDDRGHHLLAVLQRVEAFCETPIQRLGLSATVGNPEALLEWLGGRTRRPGQVIAPPALPRAQAQVTVDYVGSLANAALVISRLHQGEKRLVFCDSRARVEQLGADLRMLGVTTYVSHGSLGIDARRQAEAAFAEGDNCVIVATSTLELGIDVGDLDRVIQIDAPGSVASFLQRIGRTGRRQGTQANCLFLATDDSAFQLAAGLLLLWEQGYVEPVAPPPLPLHIVAQQLMALCLQQGPQEPRILKKTAGKALINVSQEQVNQVMTFMLNKGILCQGEGLVWMGEEGETLFGRRHFMELFAVFTSPPLFTILHGRREIGWVHEHSFLTKKEATPVLTLGGRHWRVGDIQWAQRKAWVTPCEEEGRSRWLGEGRALGFQLCQAVAQVFQGQDLRTVSLTQRARKQLVSLREQAKGKESGILVRDELQTVWWNYAGTLYNKAAAQFFEERGIQARGEALAVVFTDEAKKLDTLAATLDRLLATSPADLRVPVNQAMVTGLKFHQCVPPHLVEAVLQERLSCKDAAQVLHMRPMPR